ncbi:hypothetical protein [Cobetia sp. 1CM21F]|uniref:hypothetical protein n=1 Tax=Cobetia sp. 1CM21F TaxID=2929163 RepID=UPI0020BEFAA8|nr:hypothetical protein [Cobetia sp. 1CM21F]MCK8067044.1 hypothetical protein [Cobetia sp. 1CM21F]
MFETIVKALKEGEFITMLIVVLLSLILNIKVIYSFLYERRNVRSKFLQDALNCPDLSEETLFLLQNELVSERFKLATGLEVKRGLREEITKIYANANGELRSEVFRRSMPLLKFRDGKLQIVVTTFDLVSLWYNRIASGFLIVFSIFLLAFAWIVGFEHLTQVISLIILSVLSFFMAFLLLRETVSFHLVKEIEPYLNDYYS